MLRPLFCPICGQRFMSKTDGKLPEHHVVPEHGPAIAVNLCCGLVVEVIIRFDKCSKCGSNMSKNTAGVCRGCFTG